MKADTLIINSSRLLTLENIQIKDWNIPPMESIRGKDGIDPLGAIPLGAVAIEDGCVIETGITSEILNKYSDCAEIIDADNKLVMPGFVDCHTHLVFGGSRTSEMNMRLNGAGYLEILKSGGGIYSTVKATRAAGSDELFNIAVKRLDRMAENGTTTVEIKSGYGLNEETELKMLEVIKSLSKKHNLDIISTYLGAHTIPDDQDRKAYLDWLSGKSLKRFSSLAEFFDIFCEDGAFSLEETRFLLEEAKKEGFKLKLHGGQFNDFGSPGVAALLGAVSVDHLEHISEEDLDLMKAAGTVAVLLPGVPFFLQSSIYPDAKRFIKKGIPVALATDFNPGSCPSFSMQMMLTLGVFYCGMTVADAVAAATINAAKAINREDEIGSLKIGKKADLIILDIETPEEIPYYFGTNLVKKTIKNGRVI